MERKMFLGLMGSPGPTPESSDMVSEDGAIPEKIVSDWIELAYLIVFFCIGAPLNLIAFAQQNQNCALGEPSSTSLSRRIPPALQILNKHLNYTDLMVLFLYTPCRICWLLTYDWRGGDVLCKTMRYTDMLCFQSSSVIIVCIALNRLISIILHTSSTVKRVKVMLTIGWTYSFIMCTQQLYIFSTYEPYINWVQCTDMWEISRHEAFLSNRTQEEFGYSRRTHLILYQLTIFWIPVTLIALSYISIGCWLMRNAYVPHARNINSAQHDQVGHVAVLVTDVDNIKDSEQLDVEATSVPHSQSQHDHGVQFSLTQYKAKRRALRMSALLVVTYLLCWLPHECLSFWDQISPNQGEQQFRDDYLYFLRGLIVLNSVINPFLYGTMNDCCGR